MDAVRHFLGVVGIIIYPPALLFWFVIHPWARSWSRLGPARTYLVIVPVLVFLGGLLFQVRERLLGADLGTNWTRVGVALVFYVVSIWLEPLYRHQLSLTLLLGVPELSGTAQRKGTLLRDGIYRVVRHPRYLGVLISGVGYGLIVNYTGVYMLVLLAIPVIYSITLLEERELVDRFGEEYRQYQRDVPRLIPHWRKRS